MKLGITGDTHGSLSAMRQILRLSPPVEMWVHTGDHADDANFLAEATGLPVVSVKGNCDFNCAAKYDEFLELEDRRLWLTHGHKYLRRDERTDMKYWADIFGVDTVVYGHTHIPVFEECGGIWLINPGSPSRPRGGSKAGFMILTLRREEKPQAKFIELPM